MFADILAAVAAGVWNPGPEHVDTAARVDYMREGCALADLVAVERLNGPLHALARFTGDTVQYIVGDVHAHTVSLLDAGRNPVITVVPPGRRPPPWPGMDHDDPPEAVDNLDLRLTDLIAYVASGDRGPNKLYARESYSKVGGRIRDDLEGKPSVRRFVRFIIWTADCVAMDTANHLIWSTERVTQRNKRKGTQ